MLVSLTEKAIKEIKHIIQEQGQEQDKVALRVKVVGGGCAGYSTKLELDEVWSEEKENVWMDNGIRITIDKRSSLYIEGATIDFHEDIDKRGFIVNNPLAKNTCGCGSSFSM